MSVFFQFVNLVKADSSHVNISLPSRLDNYDPVKLWSSYEQMVTASFCSTLVRVDEQGEVVGHLLNRWSISKDFRVYTFHLRKGIKFHDGSILTASDVAYSFSRHFWKNNESGYKIHIEFALGKYNRKNEGVILDNFEIIDDFSFKVKLPKPYIPFLAMLSQNGLCILKKGEPWIGSGPMLVRRDSPTSWLLTRFDDYFNGYDSGAIKTARLITEIDGARAIDKFEKKIYDVVIGPHILKQRIPKNIKIEPMGFFASNHFIINPDKEEFLKLENRKVMGQFLNAIALKSKHIIPTYEPAGSLLPAGLFAVTNSTIPNADEKEVDAKFKKTFADWDREIKFVFVRRSYSQSFYDELADKLSDMGIKYNIKIIDGPGYGLVLVGNKYDVTHFPATIAFDDPDGFFVGTDAMFKDPKLKSSSTLKEYRHSLSKWERVKGYVRALKNFEKKWVIVPTYHHKIPIIKHREVSVPKTKHRSLFEIWKIKK